MAQIMFGSKFLAKKSCGDMTVLDAVYHKKCYTALYTRGIDLFQGKASPMLTMK